MNSRSILTWVGAVAGLAVICASSAATAQNILTNGDFSTPDPSVPAGSVSTLTGPGGIGHSAAYNWAVGNGTVTTQLVTLPGGVKALHVTTSSHHGVVAQFPGTPADSFSRGPVTAGPVVNFIQLFIASGQVEAGTNSYLPPATVVHQVYAPTSKTGDTETLVTYQPDSFNVVLIVTTGSAADFYVTRAATVGVSFSSLCGYVDQVVQDDGAAEDLCNELKAAEKAFAQGHVSVGDEHIDEFIMKVMQDDADIITPFDSNVLVSIAGALRR